MAAFVRVVEAGSFAAAGLALGLSPSAVSKLMTRLERRLGAALLRRTTRRIALTPEGELFFARATTILAEIEAAERETSVGRTPSGRVRINTSASYVTHILAGILPAFLAAYPEVAVDIVQTDAVADLVADRSDVAIRAGALPPSALTARSLGISRLLVVAAPAWLARNGAPATLADLAALDRIGFAYRRSLEDWLQPTTTSPDRVRVSDGEGVRRLALAGVGPARLAEFTVRDDIAAGRLVTLLPDVLAARIEPFHAVYVGQPDRLPGRVRVLLDHLAAHGRVDTS